MNWARSSILIVAAALAAGACKGTPDTAFLGGANVAYAAAPGVEQAGVYRAPDGSSYLSVFSDLPRLVKFTPSGPRDFSWGDDGSVELPFAPLGGPQPGAALADGSVVLLGWLDHYQLVAIRLTPAGTIDPAYGDGGQVVVSDLLAGEPAFGACTVLADGTIPCVGLGADLSPDELVLRTIDVAGDLAGTTSVPVDLARFQRPVPPTATFSSFDAEVQDLAVTPDGVVAAVSVQTTWGDTGTFDPGEPDIVVVRVASGAVDPAFGDEGYVLLDLEASGSSVTVGAGDDPAWVLDIDDWGSAGVTIAAEVHDTATDGLLGAGVRLTAGGELLASAAGGGTFPLLAPGGTVLSIGAAVAHAGRITVGGSVPGASGTEAAVLRYRPDGTLDPDFGDDGSAVMMYGAEHVHALDVRNGRLTVGSIEVVNDDVYVWMSVLWG